MQGRQLDAPLHLHLQGQTQTLHVASQPGKAQQAMVGMLPKPWMGTQTPGTTEGHAHTHAGPLTIGGVLTSGGPATFKK